MADYNDDDKSLVERTMDTVKGIATSVAVAAKSAVMPTDDNKLSDTTTAERTNEQGYIRMDAHGVVSSEATPHLASPAPPPREKKAKKTPVKLAPAELTLAPPKKAEKKAVAKKTAKQSAKKKPKTAAPKKSAKKISKNSAKKPAKKRSKKSRR